MSPFLSAKNKKGLLLMSFHLSFCKSVSLALCIFHSYPFLFFLLLTLLSPALSPAVRLARCFWSRYTLGERGAFGRGKMIKAWRIA
jgi:hypothetical protein